MMRPLVIASAQFQPTRGDTHANLNVALQYVFEAAVKGAKIVILPELCTSGAELDQREAYACSQTSEGYQSQAFIPLCRKYGLAVVFGYPELYEGELYNSAAIVSPYGVIGNARKKMLEGRDFTWANPGDDAVSPIVMHEQYRIGVLVSHDVANKRRQSYAWANEGSSFYRKGMVDLVCVPCAWKEGFSFPDAKWVNLAEEAGCSVAVSNLIFEDAYGRTGGGSCIVDRNLKVWTYGSSLSSPAVVGGLITT